MKPRTVYNETAADIENGVRAIQTEAQGLTALAASIGEGFSEATTIIHDMKARAGHSGRLIVAGIGKSGHVARKIAATMASTGTPAYFVHPGEASHGDLGMITENDIVLMLSNSGENSELSDLIHYTRRYGIPLIGMTGNPDSALARHSDIALLLPKVPEACPNGLAPTTSTTMMIALGDALAVALLARMGLTPEQYKVFHPGGKLGQRLMTVAEMMVPYADMPLIDEVAGMGDALVVLTGKNLGAVIVIDEQKTLKGIITDGDLKRHMGPDLMQKSVRAVMSPTPRTIPVKSLAVEALNAMTQNPERYLSCLVAVDEQGNPAGLIRLQDCLRAGL